MVFRVEISPEALGDLDRIAAYIGASSPPAAERWIDSMFAAMRSLAEMPRRCAVAEESGELETEVRLLLHGARNRRYKVYFAVDERTGTVRIFHVRHWAMKPVEGDELDSRVDGAGGD